MKRKNVLVIIAYFLDSDNAKTWAFSLGTYFMYGKFIFKNSHLRFEDRKIDYLSRYSYFYYYFQNDTEKAICYLLQKVTFLHQFTLI